MPGATVLAAPGANLDRTLLRLQAGHQLSARVHKRGPKLFFELAAAFQQHMQACRAHEAGAGHTGR
jgi:hypothetical protein